MSGALAELPPIDYMEDAALTRELEAIGVGSVLWLASRPETKTAAKEEGYICETVYAGPELRKGKETPRGFQSFNARLMELAADEGTDGIAILSRSGVVNGTPSRTIWVRYRPGYSD